MKIEDIYYSSYFKKAFRRLPKNVQSKALVVEKMFRKDCFDKGLKAHKLKGELGSYWSFRINYSYRILFEFQKDGSVVFIDIGTHSIYR